MITKKGHTSNYVLMDESAGGQSWVHEQFVKQMLAAGYMLAEASASPPPMPPDFGDLSSKTKKVLMAIGQELGLNIDMNMKKDEMIITIEGTG
jgi:hypothetical protein